MMATMTTPLREARKSRGLTVAQVAKAVGTDPSNMSRLELGHHAPPRELARRIYRFYEGAIQPIDLYDPTFLDEVGIIRPRGNSWYEIERRDGVEKVQGRRALHVAVGDPPSGAD